ncbi:MAG: hypothetical protein LCH56_07280 [Proteobacteria bacterium]|nr:hypothetical protein [Pseudomonadota bacterium]
MTEMDFQAVQAQAQLTKSAEPLTWPIVVYVLYLVSYLVGITAIAGIIIAHVKQEDADPVALTHFRYQTRTFWYCLLGGLIGAVLLLVLIGWLVLIAVGIWMLIRVIKGLLYALDRKPIPNPTTLLW